MNRSIDLNSANLEALFHGKVLLVHVCCSQVPDSIMKVLRDDAKNTSGMKWFSDSLSFTDIYSGPKPRYDVSSAVNIMAGSDEIAVSGILRQCAEFGE